MKRRLKIGFSDIGGIYIGKEIQTVEHLHQAITIAISFSGEFDYFHGQQNVSCKAIIMQANTMRKLVTPGGSHVAFIHIEPFSEQGLKLTNRHEPFKQLSPDQLKNLAEILQKWYSDEQNNDSLTTKVIAQITDEIGYADGIIIDERIIKAIHKIRNSENVTLKQISEYAHLSMHRFSHLFKQQAGISFKAFVQYTKLVKSLKAVYQNQNLTHASYLGGFADQAHFTRTYYKAFGILPSESVK